MRWKVFTRSAGVDRLSGPNPKLSRTPSMKDKIAPEPGGGTEYRVLPVLERYTLVELIQRGLQNKLRMAGI